MGLLTSWGAANRVIDQDLVKTYSRQRVYQDYTYVYGVAQLITIHSVWEYHRRATKSYRYVGMDRDTANACAAAMVTKYTRATKISDWNGSGEHAGTFSEIDGGTIPMAEVAVVHVAGCMYEVHVTVNEDDVRLRVDVVNNVASLFSTENSRDYDTDEDEDE